MQHWIGKQNQIAPKAQTRILVLNWVTKTKTVELHENCDEWFGAEYSPEDAIAMLQEAIDWIKEKQNEAS